MKRRLIQTNDGSYSIEMIAMDESYHSRHGALQESEHVFIDAGLSLVASEKDEFQLLEVGLGTHLNAILTMRTAIESNKIVHYTGLEPFPIELDLLEQLNYSEILDESLRPLIKVMFEAPFDEWCSIHDCFKIFKSSKKLEDFELETVPFDLVYYDAFGPRAQGELWDKEVLQKVVDLMKEDAVFVTYCAKGQVRRDLQDSGLEIERLDGPKGKREMLRGRKSAK